MGGKADLLIRKHDHYTPTREIIRRRHPLGPLGFEGAQHRQTLHSSSSRDPQQSPASFRVAVKDLEDPAVQCRWLAVSG